MAPPTQAELEAEIILLISDSQATNYFAVAGLVVVLLEHISNFGDEVELVWKTRPSLFNVFYIWIRYFTLFAYSVDVSFMFREVKSNHVCNVFLLTEMTTSTVVVILVDLILVLRVWILYGRSRKLLYFMIPLIAAELVVMIVVGVFTILPLTEFVHIGPILNGCYSLTVPRLYTYYIVPSLITAIIMFFMTAYKCGLTIFDLGPKNTPLFSLFLRDGLVWFLALVVMSILDIIMWSTARPTLAQLPSAPATGLNAVIAARVLLNLKQATSGTVMTDATTLDLDTLPENRRRPASEPWYLKTADTEGIARVD